MSDSNSDLHYLPVSLGEAMDKLSILDIKLDKITDKRRDNVKIEYDLLFKMLEKDLEKYNLFYKIMKIINLEIWDMMNLLRDVETDEFNNDYMVLCRECMISNDVRFRIKNKINYISNCSLKEQKGYKTMRILFDVRNNNINIHHLIKPIKYYSFLYDEIIILTNENDNENKSKEVLKNEFNYDPTIIITDKEEHVINLEYKKVFDLNSINYNKETDTDINIVELYCLLEITNKIINNYFVNF